MVRVARLVSRWWGMPGRSQQGFHVLDGQDRNKVFDAGSMLKLMPFGGQNPLDCGARARELVSKVLN
jgi:hypothetical protein